MPVLDGALMKHRQDAERSILIANTLVANLRKRPSVISEHAEVVAQLSESLYAPNPTFLLINRRPARR